MLKTVVVLDGEIINIGDWDYQIADIDGVEITQNPLPSGAIVEKREMEYSESFGWREVGYVAPLSDKERLTELELIINDLLLGGIL